MKTKTKTYWTPADLEKLRVLYPTTSAPDLVATFDRSSAAIEQKARSIGLMRSASNHRRWTIEEVQVLRDFYPTLGAAVVSEMIKRPVTAVLKKAQEVGVRSERVTPTIRAPRSPRIRGTSSKIGRGRYWTNEEDEFLRSALSKMTRLHIAIHLNRTKQAVDVRIKNLKLAKKCCRMGLGNSPIGTERIYRGKRERKVSATGSRSDWKRIDVIEWEAVNGPIPPGMMLAKPKIGHSEEQRLIKRSENPMLAALDQMTSEMRSIANLKGQISTELSRLEKMYAADMNSSKKRKIWNKEQDEFLLKNYIALSNKDLSLALKFTIFSVKSRLAKLGLKRHSGGERWSTQGKDQLTAIYAITPVPELSKILGRSIRSVVAKANSMGLRQRTRRKSE